MPAETPSMADITASNDKAIAFQAALAQENNRVAMAMAAFQSMMNTSSKITGR